MAVEVRIPSLLKPLVGGARTVSGDGATVAELLGGLEQRFPGIRERLVDSNGSLKQFVNIFINEEDIRFLGGLQTALKDGDVVSILPAIVGGRPGRGSPKGLRPFGVFYIPLSLEGEGDKGGEGAL